MTDILEQVRIDADTARNRDKYALDVERLARAIFIVDDGNEFVSMIDARDFAKQIAAEYREPST